MSIKRRNIFVRMWYNIFNKFIRYAQRPKLSNLDTMSAKELLEAYREDKKVQNKSEKTNR